MNYDTPYSLALDCSFAVITVFDPILSTLIGDVVNMASFEKVRSNVCAASGVAGS